LAESLWIAHERYQLSGTVLATTLRKNLALITKHPSA
jgi:hypothetical protein